MSDVVAFALLVAYVALAVLAARAVLPTYRARARAGRDRLRR